MDDTDAELRERFEQETNETPAVVDADQGDAGDDQDASTSGKFGAIPTPSVSRRQVAILAVLVAVIVVVYLAKQRDASSGGSISEARDRDWQGEVEFDGPDDGLDDDGDGQRDEIVVPVNSQDPMAADEAVTTAFRDRGLFSDGGSD